MLPPLPDLPSELWQLMAELGPNWGAAISANTRRQSEAFSAVLSRAPKLGTVTHDIPYGDHPRQVLDVYAPHEPRNAPVVLFAHGGAFVVGDKDRTPEIYANVCWYLVRHGIIGINMEYRLAPEFKYPSGIEDVASAADWTRRNIARFGGNADRLFAMGHSAGCAHVGCYAYDRRFRPAAGPHLAGLILVSGRVKIDNFPENPNANNVEAYFGADPELMRAGSVVDHVGPDCVPTMIAIAEYENPLLDIYGMELAHRLALAKRRAPRLIWLAGHNHNSSIAQLNTAEEQLGRQIIEFIETGR